MLPHLAQARLRLSSGSSNGICDSHERRGGSALRVLIEGAVPVNSWGGLGLADVVSLAARSSRSVSRNKNRTPVMIGCDAAGDPRVSPSQVSASETLSPGAGVVRLR